MSHALRAAVCLAALVPSYAAAATTAASSPAPQQQQQWSLPDAIERALAQSPLVRLARRQRDTVTSARVGAGALLPANPAVTLGAGSRRDRSGSVPPAAGAEWSLRLEQTVELAGQRGTRLGEVERHVDVARAREALARSETIARVRAAYVGLGLARAQLDAARAQERLGERVLESARARVRAGAAGDVELHLAEVEVGRLTHERIEAALGTEAAAGGLRELLALPPDATLELTTELVLPATPPLAADVHAAIAAAQARRAELQVLASTRGALDARLVRLRREIVPSPTLFVDVMSQQPQQLYVGAGLLVPIPLWRRNQGELATTRAYSAEVREEEAVTAERVALEVAQLCHAVQARRAQAERWSTAVAPAAAANVDLVHAGWTAGKFDLFRLVQVTREAADARARELRTLGELWDATIELDRATGALL